MLRNVVQSCMRACNHAHNKRFYLHNYKKNGCIVSTYAASTMLSLKNAKHNYSPLQTLSIANKNESARLFIQGISREFIIVNDDDGT